MHFELDSQLNKLIHVNSFGMSKPWGTGYLAQQIQNLTDTVAIDQHAHQSSDENDLMHGIQFHLDFLDHHLKHSLFPSTDQTENPSAHFAADPSRRFLSVLLASARPNQTSAEGSGGAAFHISSTLQPGGKPVMNQSALHGVHVFEGLQLVAKQLETGGYRFGYTFLRDKVAKLVDGIIRLRFAIHLLKANVMIRHLESRRQSEVDSMNARFSRIVNHDLPYRRSQAEEAVTQALLYFAEVNREEMTAAMERNSKACFYVRVEAQGGNRDSIGQGPIGVGQSTLQIYGQHAEKSCMSTQVVMNAFAPPRMHSLAGPFQGSPIYALLNNYSVHHGNMGHQHLASEMAKPHGTHMLMTTAEVDEAGRVHGPYIAETNFSNIGFEYDGHLIFPQSNSATYGLTQHVIRGILADDLNKGSNLEGITGFEHVPLSVDRFMTDLREGKVTNAFVMGSMPGIEPVADMYVDETLSGGPITRFAMKRGSPGLRTLVNLYQAAYNRQIVWE